MATVEQPITRSELREELRHYASKADLSQLEVRLAQMETPSDQVDGWNDARLHCCGVLRIFAYPEDTRLI